MLRVDDSDFRLYVGDVRLMLDYLDTGSIDCIVTSPPYWGLRDYGMEGQIGLEADPGLYVNELVDVLGRARRALSDRGTLWLNLGDTYAADRSYQVTDNKHIEVGNTMGSRVPKGLKPKDMVGVPWRVALALQADGWWLRSDIIWHKPNVMPSSVTDRPTTTHEYVFLLSKRADYFFDQDAVRVPYSYDGRKKLTVKAGPSSLQHRDGERWPGLSRSAHDARKDSSRGGDETEPMEIPEGGRNIRTVWEIATINYAEAHFATFPPKLAELCIKAGCPEGGTVLDPFMGSGTTALVARKLGRKSVGIEINPEYADLCAQRLQQLSLFG